MPIIRPPLQEPTDLVVAGEQLRASAMAAPVDAGLAGLVELVPDIDRFPPRKDLPDRYPRIGGRFDDPRPRANAGIATPSGAWIPVARGRAQGFIAGATDTAAPGIVGTLTQTDGADTVVVSGAVAVAASLTLTDAADTVAGAGTVAASGVTGTLVLVDAQDAVSAAGAVSVSASLGLTDAADAVDAAGAVEGATEQPVISLGGSKARLWRDYVPPLPEIKGRLWRLDDDDTVRAAAGFVEIVSSGALALNDEDDKVVATGRTLRMLRLVRDNPRAALVRSTPRAALRRAA